MDTEDQERESPDAPQPYPFCVACSFIGTNYHGEWEKFLCFADQNVKRRRANPVTGNPEVFFIFQSCSEAREKASPDGGCGLEALWFKEKEKAPERPTAEGVDIDDIIGDIEL